MDLSPYQRYTHNDIRYSKKPHSRSQFSQHACIVQRGMIVTFLYLLSNGVIYSPLWGKLECEKHSTIIYFLFKKPEGLRTYPLALSVSAYDRHIVPKKHSVLSVSCCRAFETLNHCCQLPASHQQLLHLSVSIIQISQFVTSQPHHWTKALAVINLRRDCLSMYSMQDLPFNTH